MNMKKKVLFVYYEMMIGGSTTSLLSLLQNFDYDKYDVDLLLYRNRGPLMDYIPDKVNLLPQAYVEQSTAKKVIKSTLNGTLIKAYYYGLKYKKKLAPTSQGMAYAQCTYCRHIEKEYDVAIGFLELWSDVFVNNSIKAKKKISWIHIDFEKAHYIPEIDKKTLQKSDTIVTVSEECNVNFIKSFPELKDKCVYIPNILTSKYIKLRSCEAMEDVTRDFHGLKALSVCRLAADHKGLDRGILAFAKLKNKGYNLKWYIIGEGADRPLLENIIKDNNLENDVVLLGQKVNPYPYYKFFDVFFLPSRFEGKPMAITEAQMLGVVPVVTQYASANEQIENGKTGIIVDNKDECVHLALKKVLDEPDLLERIKNNLHNIDFSNVDDIYKIYEIM